MEPVAAVAVAAGVPTRAGGPLEPHRSLHRPQDSGGPIMERSPALGIPYCARVNERTLLNLPGFHGGAFVYVYVEDTSERGLFTNPYCEPDCEHCPVNFEPRMILEIADCEDTITLAFDVDADGGRENSLHKLDTLIAALRVFREAVEAEFEHYDRRCTRARGAP